METCIVIVICCIVIMVVASAIGNGMDTHSIMADRYYALAGLAALVLIVDFAAIFVIAFSGG